MQLELLNVLPPKNQILQVFRDQTGSGGGVVGNEASFDYSFILFEVLMFVFSNLSCSLNCLK